MKAKNNCEECYYCQILSGYAACLYILETGVSRPCKIVDCEIWKRSPKGTIPENTYLMANIRSGAKKRRNKLSKAQAEELLQIIMGKESEEVSKSKRKKSTKKVCANCLKEISRDAVFCQYCGTKVEVKE